MAVGWAQDNAVHDQMDATVASLAQKAQSRLPEGESPAQCVKCNGEIPAARRQALPGVRYCVPCQAELERQL